MIWKWENSLIYDLWVERAIESERRLKTRITVYSTYAIDYYQAKRDNNEHSMLQQYFPQEIWFLDH